MDAKTEPDDARDAAVDAGSDENSPASESEAGASDSTVLPAVEPARTPSKPRAPAAARKPAARKPAGSGTPAATRQPRASRTPGAPRKSGATPVSAVAESRSRTARATGASVDEIAPPPLHDATAADAASDLPVRTPASSPRTPRRAPAKRVAVPKSASQAASLVAPTTVPGVVDDLVVEERSIEHPAIAVAPLGELDVKEDRVEAPTIEQPPVEAPPVKAPPVEVPPVEQPPVEEPPAEESPAEEPPAQEPEVVSGQDATVAIRTGDEADPVVASRELVLFVEGLTKTFDGVRAVDGIDLAVRAGSIFGIVGPNGAGKTTTLSMITGLLRPDSGRVLVHGADVWKNPVQAKRNMGVLPDRLRLFDRLTGAQLLFYSGSLRGLDRPTVKSRSRDLAVAFGLEDALSRLVTDYSAGMTKKIALAAAMIHSPRLLILDEPFEAVDPVSAANVIEILQKYVAAGGTVVMSSHSMDLIQRICDSVSIIVRGEVLAAGTMDEVREGASLEDRFVELAGGRKAAEGMEWLHSFSG